MAISRTTKLVFSEHRVERLGPKRNGVAENCSCACGVFFGATERGQIDLPHRRECLPSGTERILKASMHEFRCNSTDELKLQPPSPAVRFRPEWGTVILEYLVFGQESLFFHFLGGLQFAPLGLRLRFLLCQSTNTQETCK